MTFTVRHSGVMTATARTRRGATLAIAARAMSVAIVVSIAMFSSAILSAAFPKPDGGSVMFTDGSVAWTTEMYYWDANHIMSVPTGMTGSGF